MKFIQRTVIVFLLIGFIKCQSLNDLNVDDAKEMIQKGLGDLNLPDLPDIDLNNTNLPNVEDAERILREKCKQKGAEDVVDFLKEEQNKAVECLESYVNLTLVQEELEKAKSNGSMDEVFAKYCKKWPDIHACFDNATSLARQCLDKNEDRALNKTLDILNQLQEFMCFKDGDRLAMFVAENGIECVQHRTDGIQDCLNKTIGAKIPDADDVSVTSLPIMLFTEENCDDFETVRECINVELEKCENSSPANIIDALFKFLKKQLPCSKALKASDKSSSNWSATVSVALLIGSFVYVGIF